MLPSQESKSQSLLSAWITKCRSLLQKSGLQCVLSYHSRKTHSYKQEIMSKCTYSATHFMVGKPTAIIKPPNLWVCCTCHSHNLNSKCSLMICWQLTCSRFAFSLKSSTSPAWNTMFSLGQQNRAMQLLFFTLTLTGRGTAHIQRHKYSLPHGWEWVLLCSSVTSSNSQLEVF